jgi:adhesin transport system outer membrane protein
MKLSFPSLALSVAVAMFMGSLNTVHAQTLPLSEVLKQVRTNSPQVLQQQATIKAKQFGAKAVYAQRLPSFSIDGGVRTAGDRASGAALASMPVLTFGKQENQEAVAQAEFELESKKLVQVQNDAMENAAQVYASLYNLNEKIKVSRVSLAEQSELFARIERREAAGYASESDKRTIEVRLVQLKSQIEELTLKQKERFSELSILMNRSIGTDQGVVLPKLDLPMVEESNAKLRNSNPALQIAKAQLVLVEKQANEITTSDRPTVNAVATQPVSDPNSAHFSLGLEFKYTYGNLGAAKRERQGQYASLLEAKAKEIEVTYRDIRRRYESAETGIRLITEEQLSTQRNIVKGLEENVTSYVRQYQAGRKSLYELVNTHRELNDARLKVVDLMTDYFQRSITVLSLHNQLTQIAEM